MTDNVVVTGLGAVTPLGVSPAEILRRVKAGECAAGPPTRFDASSFSCPVCAEIADFDARALVGESKTLRLMNADAILAVAAARLAMRDARITVGKDYRSDRIALYGASGMAGLPLREVAPLIQHSVGRNGGFDPRRFGTVALKRVRPVLSFKILSNMPVSFISIFEGIRGPNAVYNPWEGQGAHAVIAGIRAIQRGKAACALVGGCDVKTHELAFVSLAQQGVFEAWRRGNTGPVPGEGAAFLVLEREQRARERSATVYARFAGYRLGTRRSSDSPPDLHAGLVAPLLEKPLAALVSAADDSVSTNEGPEADTVLRPKRHTGNLFAAAAALQVVVGAALAKRSPAGARVLVNCFGHGTEQAAFLLEAL